MEMLDSHLRQFDEYFELANTNPKEAICKAYLFIKMAAPYYYIENHMDNSYETLIEKLKALELKCFKHKYLLDYHCFFKTTEPPSKEDLLDYIIWCGRKQALKHSSLHLNELEDLSQWDFTNACYVASKKIKNTCRELGIKCHLIRILPGYDPFPGFFSRFNFHYFNIIEIDSDYYLVDVTLSQFFWERFNHPDRLGIANLDGPSIGCYMMRLKNGKDIASQLFNFGYIKMDAKIFKTYMDSFTLSFRNGLYYEENDNDIILPYSIEKYVDFLKGKDSQLKREKKHCLGVQEHPLKNPNFSVFDRL
jgi:hypothetical protein